MERACSIDGCDRPVLARGWCKPHYGRWSRHGDPLGGKPSPRPFWDWVDKDGPGGCWLWTGHRDRAGYGICPKAGLSKYAHRRSYMELIGPVPEGTELDHLCRNPPCCNPAHLEPVAHQENVRRGKSGWERTHCPQGHPYDEANSYRHGGKVFCRACNRAASRRYNATKRRKG